MVCWHIVSATVWNDARRIRSTPETSCRRSPLLRVTKILRCWLHTLLGILDTLPAIFLYGPNPFPSSLFTCLYLQNPSLSSRHRSYLLYFKCSRKCKIIHPCVHNMRHNMAGICNYYVQKI